MRRFSLVVACILAVSLSRPAFAGLLTGDQVSLELFGSVAGSFETITPTVAAGQDGTLVGGNIGVDFDAGGAGDVFSLTSIGGPFGGVLSNTAGDTVEFRLTDLNFAGGATLTSVNIVTSFSNVSTPTLTGSSVTFKWDEITVPANTLFFSAQFVTSGGGGGAVPEPASVAMWGLGILGIALVKRRRK